MLPSKTLKEFQLLDAQEMAKIGTPLPYTNRAVERQP